MYRVHVSRFSRVIILRRFGIVTPPRRSSPRAAHVIIPEMKLSNLLQCHWDLNATVGDLVVRACGKGTCIRRTGRPTVRFVVLPALPHVSLSLSSVRLQAAAAAAAAPPPRRIGIAPRRPDRLLSLFLTRWRSLRPHMLAPRCPMLMPRAAVRSLAWCVASN